MKPRIAARRVAVLGLLLALATAACALPASAPTPTPPVPTEPAPSVTPPPVETAAPVATPTAPAQPAPLPAALYFISAADGQLWRLERDGVTLTPITTEAAPVTYYDVSPADGSLVYISANSLLLAAADGSQRELVFAGPQDYPEDQTINHELTWPRFSPDGRRITFGYGGIQLLDLDSPMRTPNVLIPSDALPDMSAGRPPELLYFYRRALWSPDGSRLLVEFLHYPEGGGWGTLLLNADGEGAWVELQSPPEGGLLCCEPTWSPDSQYVYFASPYVGMGSPGLRRSNAVTGQVETLIAPTGEIGNETYYMVEKAQLMEDDGLYYFLGTVQGFPTGAFTPMTMYRAGAAADNGTPLRADTYTLEEVLWADDASGAVIMEVGDGSVFPYHGPLVWLPAATAPAVRLPAEGAHLTWAR